MANYICKIRTNYFRVKDPDAFRNFMGMVYGAEGNVELWESRDGNGVVQFGFGADSGIAGLRSGEENDDLDESSYDAFIEGLQLHVEDDDAVIILEIGSERLRYVVGSATIITKQHCEYLSISDIAKERAAQLLENPQWETVCEY